LLNHTDAVMIVLLFSRDVSTAYIHMIALLGGRPPSSARRRHPQAALSNRRPRPALRCTANSLDATVQQLSSDTVNGDEN
jgi:hypothetical protein